MPFVYQLTSHFRKSSPFGEPPLFIWPNLFWGLRRIEIRWRFSSNLCMGRWRLPNWKGTPQWRAWVTFSFFAGSSNNAELFVLFIKEYYIIFELFSSKWQLLNKVRADWWISELNECFCCGNALIWSKVHLAIKVYELKHLSNLATIRLRSTQPLAFSMQLILLPHNEKPLSHVLFLDCHA